MDKKKIDWRVLCVGIVCLTIAECYALSQGINGTVYSLFLIIIAGVVGITIPTPQFIQEKIEGGKNGRRK